MFPTLRQQLPSRFLAQRLQQVELLIESLGSTTHAGLGQFFQPVGAVVRGIDLLAGTGNGPTAIQPFEPIHHPGEIFGDGQIAAGQFLQCAYTRFSVVHRREKSAAQQLASLRASTRSFLFPALTRAFFRGSHTTTFVTCGSSRSYSHAALVPSSNVTHQLPRSPRTNSRIVADWVSMIDSITSFPAESRTATAIVA